MSMDNEKDRKYEAKRTSCLDLLLFRNTSMRFSHGFQKTVLGLAVLYLLLPNILFLFGWVEPYVALPVSLLVVVAGVIILISAKTRKLACSPKDWFSLFIVLLGCLLLTEMISFHGHALQMSDFFVRNPIYDTLVTADWPVFNFKGEYFVYYLAYWLPPALFSKLTENCINPQTVLFLWTWLGMALAFSSLFLRIRWRVLPFFIILCLLGSLLDWVNFSGGDVWNYMPQTAAKDCLWSVNHYVSAIRYFMWPAQVMQTFNHSVPLILVFSLLCCGNVQWKHTPFVAALVISSSPLGGVSLLVVLLLRLWPYFFSQNGVLVLLRNMTVWFALALLLPLACFFRLSPGSDVTFMSFSLRHQPLSLWASLLCYALNVAILVLPAFLLLHRKLLTRNSLFIGFILLVSCTPLPWVGVDNNELMFKAGAVFYPCLAWCYMQRFRTACRRWRVVFCAFLVLCSGNIAYRTGKVVLSYSWSPEKMAQNRIADADGVRSIAEGTVYGDFVHYERFWTTKRLPFFFLQTDGVSADKLMSPFATGVKASQLGL